MVDTNYYIKIGLYIKELREKNNMTKSYLAEGICSVSYITRIEKGERCPTSVILRQLANKLGVNTEYLFRAIESSTSLQVQELLDQIFIYLGRSDLKKLKELLNQKEEELDITSIHDMQIIRTFKCLGLTFSNRNYQQGMDELKDILALTYNEGNNPTDIEFIIMFSYGKLLLVSNQREKAYNHLKSIEKHWKNIKHFRVPFIIPAFYRNLILACFDTSNLREASMYLDFAIDYCKKNNTYGYLRDLYFLKAELFDRLNNEREFIIWYNKSLTLHEMIKYSDNDHFDKLVKERLELLEKLKKAN